MFSVIASKDKIDFKKKIFNGQMFYLIVWFVILL